MIKKVKILGVTLATVMAFGAVAASAASAVSHHFNATVGDPINSAAISEFEFVHTTGDIRNNGCKSVTMAGEAEAATGTSLKLTPSFSECGTFEGEEFVAPMKFIMNECYFRFTGATTSGNPTGGEHANIHLECPKGKSMETRATALNLKCGTIGSQEIKHAVRYENETTAGDEKKHIKIITTGHGITSTTHSFCGEGTHTNGSIAGEITLTAPNGISISTT